jgi:hypothetical protein
VTATDKTAIFTITFTVGYAVIYVICTEFNLPVLTYHPVLGQIDFLWTPERRGPAMYWYGWMLTALIGATLLASIAILIPEKWMQRTIMFGALVAVGYLIVYSAALLIYDSAAVELEFLKSRWLSVMAALVLVALASLFVPEKLSHHLWPGWVWVVPIGALAVLGYYLTPYFTR